MLEIPTSAPAEAGAHSPLDALIGRHGAMWRTFALPEVKVFYIQVNKNACTSLKWMLAAVAGEDLTAFTPSLQAATNEHDDIHNRRKWQVVPWLDQMTSAQRAQIHPDNGWFVFGVVRDPRSRLFSAWQNKLLLENPGCAQYRNEPWYPRHPLDANTVVEDFAKFVDLFERQPRHRICADGHFCDQVAMLHLDVVSYTKIYDIRELDTLLTDLRRHLDSVGWQGELHLPKLNDTPLPINAQPFRSGVRERIEKIYAADFELFGDRWDFGRVEAQPDWTEQQLHEAEWRAVYGRRIGYLRDEARNYRTKLQVSRERTRAARARAEKRAEEVRQLKAQLRALQARRLGAVLAKLVPARWRVRLRIRRR